MLSFLDEGAIGATLGLDEERGMSDDLANVTEIEPLLQRGTAQ